MSTWRSVPRTVLEITLIVVAVVLTLVVIWILRQPLTWLFVAGFLSIALSGAVNFFGRRMRRSLAIALTYLLVLLTPVAIVALVVPPFVNQAVDLAEKLPQYVADIQDEFDKNTTLRKLNDKFDLTGKVEQEAAKIPGQIGGAASALGSIGSRIVSTAFAGITILILSIFMTSSWPEFRRWLLARQPPDRARRLEPLFGRVATAVGSYCGGALLQATIAGLATLVVLLLLGVPFAVPLAIITLLFDLIPLVGATIAAVFVGLITAFDDFPTDTIIWTIWAIAYQQFENNVIQPRIQSRATDVHPLIVLTSVLFGAKLFGVLGALLAVPIAAALQITVREYAGYRRELTARGEAPPPPGGAEEGGSRGPPAPGGGGAPPGAGGRQEPPEPPEPRPSPAPA